MARTGLIKKPAAASGSAKAGGGDNGGRKARSQASSSSSSSSKPAQAQGKRATPSRGKQVVTAAGATTTAAKASTKKGKARAGDNTRDEAKRLEVDQALEGAVRQTKKPEAQKKATTARNPPLPKRLSKAEQEEMVNRLGSTTLGGCPWWDK